MAKSLAEWQTAVGGCHFDLIHITVGRKKNALREDQKQALELWLTGNHDEDWLVLDAKGCPKHFLNREGKANKLTLARPPAPAVVGTVAAISMSEPWFWASDLGTWNPFEDSQARKLQNARSAGRSDYLLVIAGDRYSVDFGTMAMVLHNSVITF